MSVTAFPVARKRKSFDICQAFVEGCGGSIGTGWRCDGPTFFYGVDESNLPIWQWSLASGHDVWYADNSYFDATRGQRFRITRNRLQHSGFGISSGARFAELGIHLAPWRDRGEHIVVCPQSDHFMGMLAGYDRARMYQGAWLSDLLLSLDGVTDRPLRIRDWNRDKGAQAATLGADLVGAHALITWSSAAAVTAILAGVPAISLADDAAARALFPPPLNLEDLPRPDRLNWAGVLADNEFTLEEMRDGTAWRRLNAEPK